MGVQNNQTPLLTWNFSSSEVTSPWAWARGVWHLSMHWWTWDMESEGRLQQSALQLNIRPCGKVSHMTGWTVAERKSSSNRCKIKIIGKTPTCILRMWSLSRLWTISSTTFCMRAWCASAIFSRCSLRQIYNHVKTRHLCVSVKSTAPTQVLYLRKAYLRSPPFKHGPKGDDDLPNFRFGSVNFFWQIYVNSFKAIQKEKANNDYRIVFYIATKCFD